MEPITKKSKATKKSSPKTSAKKLRKTKVVDVELAEATSSTRKLKTRAEKVKESELNARKLNRVKLPSPTRTQLKPFKAAAKATKKIQKAKERSKKKKTNFLAKLPRKGKKYSLDLRIHSPGSDTFQTPASIDPVPAIISLAKVKGLDFVGITDYSNASHIDRIKLAAEESQVTVIPGLDLRCKVGNSNWITILALFPESYGTKELSDVLATLEVPFKAYGSPDYCLELPLKDVVEAIEKAGGAIIPSRVDRTPNQRCAIPTLIEDLGFHAFDLVHPDKHDFFQKNWPEGEFTFFSFSNASALGQIGSRNSETKLTKPGFEGIKELVARR